MSYQNTSNTFHIIWKLCIYWKHPVCIHTRLATPNEFVLQWHASHMLPILQNDVNLIPKPAVMCCRMVRSCVTPGCMTPGCVTPGCGTPGCVTPGCGTPGCDNG